MTNMSCTEIGVQGFSLSVCLSVICQHRNGRIERIGGDGEIKQTLQGHQFDEVIDCTGKCIIPGLVDAHTHAMWLGDRVHEFSMKLAGASYMEVHRAGGGINFTVRHIQSASDEDLYTAFVDHAKRMSQAGTTLMECKTGYGLRLDAELRMLRALTRAKRDDRCPVDVSITYCAAHAVPEDSTPEEATDDVINVHLPEVGRLRDTGHVDVDGVDVFCEQGVFSVDQARRILEAGMNGLGLEGNFHGEELHCLNSAEMGAALKVRAISHLEEISDAGIDAMAASGTIGVMLPTTAFMLRLKPPPARRMIDAGVPLALGSDFNPNAHCLAMPIVMHLACVLLRLTMVESLVAATINAAASLGKAASYGSIEVGKVADIVILDAPRWEHLIYQFGSYGHVISHVIKSGHVVHRK